MTMYHHARRITALRLSHWRSRLRAAARLPHTANTVLITAWTGLAETQMYPFHYYKRRLAKERSIVFAEIDVHAFLDEPTRHTNGGPARHIQHVFVQPPLGVEAVQAIRLLELVRATFPQAQVCLMDWFAPVDVRLAAAVNPYIARYVKKQVLRDWSAMSAPWVGDSNLTDHYNRKAGVLEPEVRYPMPADFESKLVLGNNFAFSTEMIDLFLRAQPRRLAHRSIDIHARLATKGVPWYRTMREEAQSAIDQLQGYRIVSHGRVRRAKFYAELNDSKLCFSPFGYGEVCWRDYEGFATGTVVLKPTMEHLRTHPESFVPNETYIPLQWDLSDLADKVRYYLGRPEERLRIATNAFELHRRYILEDQPYHHMLKYFA